MMSCLAPLEKKKKKMTVSEATGFPNPFLIADTELLIFRSML